MTLRIRTAALLLVVAVAAAPSIAIAAMTDASCCCPSPPCHGMTSECEMVLADGPCCDQAPPALLEVAKRHPLPGSVVAIPARFARVIAARCARTRVPAGDLELRVSPLRLSVVLRI